MMDDSKMAPAAAAAAGNKSNLVNVSNATGFLSSDEQLVYVHLFSNDFVKAQEEMWRQFTDLKMSSSHRLSANVDTPLPPPEGHSCQKDQPQHHHQSCYTNKKACASTPPSYPCDDDERQQENYFNLFEDDAMIEEQRRILLKIQQESAGRSSRGRQQAGCALTSSTHCEETFTTTVSSDVDAGGGGSLSNFVVPAPSPASSSIQVLSSSSSPRASNYQEQRRHYSGTEECSTSSSATKLQGKNKGGASSIVGDEYQKGGSCPTCYHQKDRVVQMGQHKLRVKGTNHAIDSISTGSAIIVQCSSCQAILQVGSTAKLLYCVHCQQVTPIEVARNVSGGRIGATDGRIAKAIQIQEVDIASARKQQQGLSSVEEGEGTSSSRVSVISRSRWAPRSKY